jgi:hypothetical protein
MWIYMNWHELIYISNIFKNRVCLSSCAKESTKESMIISDLGYQIWRFSYPVLVPVQVQVNTLSDSSSNRKIPQCHVNSLNVTCRTVQGTGTRISRISGVTKVKQMRYSRDNFKTRSLRAHRYVIQDERQTLVGGESYKWDITLRSSVPILYLFNKFCILVLFIYFILLFIFFISYN